MWATFDTPQSRSLLEGEEVDFVRFVGGRDPVNVARNLPAARRILRDAPVDTMVSTGSAVALPFFALGRARRLRLPLHRERRPQRGAVADRAAISRIPGVRLYASARLGRGALALSRLGLRLLHRRRGRERTGRAELRKVVVTLGTYRDFGFPLLIERLLEMLPPEAEVLWQTGETDTGGPRDRRPPARSRKGT